MLVRQARDRERQEAPLLTLLEELECSGAVDPVAYLHQLVRQDRLQHGMSEALIAYERLPYSHLVGIQTPAARRERWRRAVWTIMMHNRACVRSEDRWFVNPWAVLTLAGGDVRSVGRYLEERSEGLRRHHDLYEVHPNMNQKAVSIIDDLSLPEDPLPPDGEAFWAQIDEQRDL
ncbi:hypothetical protein KSC_072990 [Ktedonobacter sp. SOSP1-52]|uniref:hypothetical protein n=1 Tax=Ktedonobacter sp. SOSP1-52 TaxID=2778366 RepID=UPI001915696B|nr:hypothetical protein [Ktedonobacter sp. SOSP1-52]GHO68407.1 hypothetical protein KSC_072990 [Ktedonobacter sp. SOSP1-52]